MICYQFIIKLYLKNYNGYDRKEYFNHEFYFDD